MFEDERLVVGRGKALRKTIRLATMLLALQTVMNWVFQLVNYHKFNPVYSWMSLVATVAGLIILILGNLRYGYRPQDEREEGLKCRYFYKSFPVYIGSWAAAFSLMVPLDLILRSKSTWDEHLIGYLGRIDIIELNANNALALLLGPCWIYLLLLMKKQDMPLNAEMIGEGNRDYWKKVFIKLAKFLGKCLAFTFISWMLTLLLAVLRPAGSLEMETLMTLATALAFVKACSVIFFSFSVEYLIYSVIERSSEKAKEQEKISRVSAAIAVIGFVTAALAIIFNGIPVSDIDFVKLEAQIENLGKNAAFMSIGIAMAYAISELRETVNESTIKKLYLAGGAILITRCAEMFLNSFYQCCSFTVIISDDSPEWYYRMITPLTSVVQIICGIFVFIALISLFLELRREGLAQIRHVLIPIAAFAADIVYIFVVVYFGHSETMLLFSFIYAAILSLYMIFTCRTLKRTGR